MAVGYPVDKRTIDQRAGSLVERLRITFAGIQTLKDWLDETSDAALGAAPFGYSTEDIATLRAGITDLSNLGKIAHAQGTQAQANDFFFNADRLTGIQ